MAPDDAVPLKRLRNDARVRRLGALPCKNTTRLPRFVDRRQDWFARLLQG